MDKIDESMLMADRIAVKAMADGAGSCVVMIAKKNEAGMLVFGGAAAGVDREYEAVAKLFLTQLGVYITGLADELGCKFEFLTNDDVPKVQ
jgi:hypothetical protein